MCYLSHSRRECKPTHPMQHKPQSKKTKNPAPLPRSQHNSKHTHNPHVAATTTSCWPATRRHTTITTPKTTIPTTPTTPTPDQNTRPKQRRESVQTATTTKVIITAAKFHTRAFSARTPRPRRTKQKNKTETLLTPPTLARDRQTYPQPPRVAHPPSTVFEPRPCPYYP